MRPARTRVVALVALALAGTVVAPGCDGDEPSVAARCRSVTAVVVRVGSRVDADHVLGGSTGRCDDPEVARVATEAERLLRLTEHGGDGALVVHLDPVVTPPGAPVTHVETHRASGGILVAGSALLAIDDTEWLHEIAHARMRRAPSARPIEERILSALEEGVADYFAASYAESPILGHGARDLRAGPSASAADWASLAGVGPPFREHRHGWAFAAAAWSVAGADQELASDLVAALAGSRTALERDTPAAAVAAVKESCPERSRAKLGQIFEAWFPEELREP